MKEKITPELIEQLKACKSAEEVLALAKEIDYEMTEEEAAQALQFYGAEGELSDDELDNIAGGKRIGGKDRKLKSLVSMCTRTDSFWNCDKCGQSLYQCHCYSRFEKEWCCNCKHLEYTKGGWYCMNDLNSN